MLSVTSLRDAWRPIIASLIVNGDDGFLAMVIQQPGRNLTIHGVLD